MRSRIAALAALLVLPAFTMLAAEPAAAQAGARASETRRIRAAYVAEHEYTVAALQSANEVAMRYKRVAEQRQSTIRTLREEQRLAAGRSRQQLQALEQRIRRLEEEMVEATEAFTAELARQNEEYRRNREILLTAANQLLETPQGREVLELIAQGGRENAARAAELTLFLHEERQAIRRAAAAIDSRTTAVTLLGLRGNGPATTERIIQLYEEVVASDPSQHWDWVELARLYRIANDLQKASAAATRAYQTASSDRDRVVALIEQGDTLKAQASFAGVRDLEEALALFATEATRLFGSAANNPPSPEVAQALVSRIMPLFNLVQLPDHVNQADRVYAQALEQVRRLHARDTGSTLLREDVAVALQRKASTAMFRFQFERLMNARSVILDIMRRLNQARSPAEVQAILAEPLSAPEPDSREILSHLGERLTILEEAARSVPSNVIGQLRLAAAHSDLGEFHATRDRFQEALASYTTSLAILRPLAEQNPHMSELQADYALALLNLGKAQERLRQTPEAERNFRQALSIFERLAEADPRSSPMSVNIARTLERLAFIGAAGFSFARLVAHLEGMQRQGLFPPGGNAMLALARAFARAEAAR